MDIRNIVFTVLWDRQSWQVYGDYIGCGTTRISLNVQYIAVRTTLGTRKSGMCNLHRADDRQQKGIL
jgi:hypothetical protein